jgi:hypothetical protein
MMVTVRRSRSSLELRTLLIETIFGAEPSKLQLQMLPLLHPDAGNCRRGCASLALVETVALWRAMMLP